MIDNSGARRSINKRNALVLAKLGIPVFPSSGKVPLIPRYNKLDTAITAEDYGAALEKWHEDHGEDDAPAHVGATTNVDVVKKMWRKHPDAVPSISCGPAGLVVLDADSKDDGPAKMDALFEENGGVPAGVPIIPSKSGGKHFVFSDPLGERTNKAGLLKKNYGTDVRGNGGQFVAPGSIREDGKTYGTEKDFVAFCKAMSTKALPELPSFIAELIGAPSDSAAPEEIAPSREREVIAHLSEVDWPEHEELFEPAVGLYDLDALKANNPDFGSLYDAPGDDCSTNRFVAARMVMTEWPEMPVEHLAVFFEGWEGAGSITDAKPKSGEYDLRQVAREWLKNQGLSKPSAGDAFGAVDDPDDADDEPAPAVKSGELRFLSSVARYSDPNYIVENIATRGMVGMLHAPSNAGKTFSAFHLGGCLSEGWTWFGRNVEQCAVLYCYGEGHAGIERRALAWSRRYEPQADALVFRDGIPNFATHAGKAAKAIREAVKNANAMLAERGRPPVAMLMLDTFAKAVAGAEESSAREMQPILNALRAIAVELDLCILIVHHSGKDTALGARGSSAIFADVDFNLEIVSEQEAKKRKITVKPGHMAIIMPKMRDSGKGGRFEFRLEEVRLGTNKWGNPVTSMVVVEVDDKPSDGAAMGAVTDDEEAPASDDKLTPDQNAKAEEARLSLCGKVVEALKRKGQIVAGRAQLTVDEACELVPALGKIKREADKRRGGAAALKDALMHGEPRTLLSDLGGWLEYVPTTGRKSSLLAFSART